MAAVALVACIVLAFAIHFAIVRPVLRGAGVL
jgi:hypothetical protein